MMNDKLKNFLIRTASGIVLLAVMLGAIMWSKWSFGVLLLAIIIGGEREFYRMATKAGYKPQKLVGYLAGAYQKEAFSYHHIDYIFSPGTAGTAPSGTGQKYPP